MKKNGWMGRTTLAALGALAALGGAPETAHACGGAWYPAMMEVEPDVDYRIQGVPRAEEALEQGKILAAAGRIIRMMPHVKTLSPKSAKIVERAQRVLALAVVRQDGSMALGRELPDAIEGTWLGKTAADRHANLTWAVDVLRKVSTLKGDDPMSQTELAEGLARLDGKKGEARTILESLAKKDLITSPEGYAALAELRGGAGDTRGQRLAMQRCRKMAKDSSACSAIAS
jgi:hypothetical protein